MTPMIDIVFLLLVFFMTISQISEVKKTKMDLPKLAGSEDQKPSHVTVNITRKGKILLAQKSVSLAELANVMQKELAKVGENADLLNVVVRADKEAKCREVNQVVTRLSQLQIKKVRIAVDKASAFPGGTNNPVSRGTVSGIAPPVVLTMGNPRARASASTMP